jgi:hypothetical protein
MSPHQCSACRVFIHDTLSVPISRDELYYGYYNLKCIPKLIPELVPEFQKLVCDHPFELTQTPLRKHTTYIAIRLIESGLVKRKGISFHGEITKGKPLTMALDWIYHYFNKLKHLESIHHDHTGGYKEVPHGPLPPHILMRYEDAGFVSIKDKGL